MTEKRLPLLICLSLALANLLAEVKEKNDLTNWLQESTNLDSKKKIILGILTQEDMAQMFILDTDLDLKDLLCIWQEFQTSEMSNFSQELLVLFKVKIKEMFWEI